MRHLPMMYGLALVIMLFGGGVALFRWVGFNRLDALYLAGLTITLIGYFLSKYLMRSLIRK